jgi:predicted amidohydrolase
MPSSGPASRERTYAAACQWNRPPARDRPAIAKNVDHMIAMTTQAVVGYRPLHRIGLVVFPEFAWCPPMYDRREDLIEHQALDVPNELSDKLVRCAQDLGVHIQAGSLIERDRRFPEHVFNTTLLVGPDGILSKYRKVNPWIPWEVHSSPAEIPGYPDPLFPVVETEIGRLGVATCYDWLFPEVTRELALNGAEILIRISAYMDPWGATPPMDWWTVVNRCRAIENIAYVVAANQGATLENYPPSSWPGGSMVVDFDGRILAQADPGAGEKIVIAPLDLAALRAARRERQLHNFLAHRRGSAYPASRDPGFRGPAEPRGHTIEDLTARIEDRKKTLGYGAREESR